jgi:predicted nucleic acid-binding protein
MTAVVATYRFVPKKSPENGSMRGAPNKVVVDSRPLIALFDAGDTHHRAALAFVRKCRASLLSTRAAITEAMYVLDESLEARKNLLTWIQSGGLTLIEPETDDFGRIIELMSKYADLPMDFTDAVIVALCERLGVSQVASVDRHFAIYRFKGRTKFTNLFFA